jgi:hypothetical protein
MGERVKPLHKVLADLESAILVFDLARSFKSELRVIYATVRGYCIYIAGSLSWFHLGLHFPTDHSEDAKRPSVIEVHCLLFACYSFSRKHTGDCSNAVMAAHPNTRFVTFPLQRVWVS